MTHPNSPEARAKAREWIVNFATRGPDWELPEAKPVFAMETVVDALLTFSAERNPSPLPAVSEGGTCSASPDHKDIIETIANAADEWKAKGYTSALAEVRDMANVGRALMEALPKGYAYNDCPSEIVADLINERDDALALAPATTAVGWQDIASAPKDGTRFLALRLSRYRGESRTETVWWQPEFDAFISSCRLMEMAPGYTIDGQTSQLHSPDVFEATHWLCVIPALPVHPTGGGSRG